MDAAYAAAISAPRPELGEVEDGIASTAVLRNRTNPAPPETSIDILEISQKSEPHVQWHEKFDHDKLVQHFSEVGHLLILIFAQMSYFLHPGAKERHTTSGRRMLTGAVSLSGGADFWEA